MKFRQNISVINALMRITCGITFLTWAMTNIVRKPWKNQSYLLVIILSSMKIGEGILRYCPIVDVMENGRNSREKSQEEQ